MNSLSHGFLFLVGLAWLFCEVCISAGGGHWGPVWLFVIGFIVMFSMMGCLPLSAKTINIAGPIFTLIIAAGIFCYGIDAFFYGTIGGLVRLFGSGVLAVMGVVSLINREQMSEAH